MNATDVLKTLPLLIYGIAIAELFSQWKRFVGIQRIYPPYVLLTLLLTEIAFYNVFLFAQLVDEIRIMSYRNYLVYLFPSVIFMITVYSFTPEKEEDTETYFIKNMPVFLSLIAIFIASHFLFSFEESTIVTFGRIVVILWLLLTAFYKRIWMVYIFVGLWFLLLFSR